MRIRWEEDALSDLAALRAYIQQDNPDAAQRVAQRIIESVKLLAAQPFLGEPGRIHKTRELVVSKTDHTLLSIIPQEIRSQFFEYSTRLESGRKSCNSVYSIASIDETIEQLGLLIGSWQDGDSGEK